ncbi:MAG: DUF1674 domain-containing protein [Candidatus Rariloculaceae bacterium]
MRRLQKADKCQDKGVAPGMETKNGNDGGVSSASESGQTGRPQEVDGPKGPEPTRFGDWERAGRCIDF